MSLFNYFKNAWKYLSSPSLNVDSSNGDKDQKDQIEGVEGDGPASFGKSVETKEIGTQDLDSGSASESSIASDPEDCNNQYYESRKESIHIGSTERLSLVQQGYSHQFRSGGSLDLLGDTGSTKSSSQGYWSQDGQAGPLGSRTRSCSNLDTPWKDILTHYRSSQSIAEHQDVQPTDQTTLARLPTDQTTPARLSTDQTTPARLLTDDGKAEQQAGNPPPESPASQTPSANGEKRSTSTQADGEPSSSEVSSGKQAPFSPNFINVNGEGSIVQINMDNIQGADGRSSRASNAPVAQLFAQHGRDRWTSITARSECQIAKFLEEDTTVMTVAIKRLVEMLAAKEGDHVAIVVGHNYDGKTTTALSGIAELLWDPAIIVKPGDMDHIPTSCDKKTCILKDDLFGKHELNSAAVEAWEERFDEILSMAQAGKMGAVFTVNKMIYERYMAKYNRHELFKEDNIIDLTSSYKLSNDEKVGMLKCHLQLFGTTEKLKLMFTEKKREDNMDSYKGNGILFIWTGYLNEIAELPCAHGFPKQSLEYASSLDNVRMRSEFFKRPLKFHCLAVSSIRESGQEEDKIRAFALETTLVCRGEAPLNMVEEKFGKVLKSKMKTTTCTKYRMGTSNKLPDGFAIIEKQLNCYENPEVATSMFTKGHEMLRNWLLQEQNGTVSFTSTAVQHATALVVSERFGADVAKCVPLDFIHNCVRPSDSSDRKDQCLHISEYPKKNSLKHEVCRRLLADVIVHGNVANVCNHQLMTRRWFVFLLIEELEQSKNNTLTKFLERTDVKTGMTVLFHGMERQFDGASDTDPQNLTDELVRRALWGTHCKNERLKRKQEKEALYRACKLGIFSTYVCLRKNLDVQHLKLAAESGSADITEDILNQRRFGEFSQLCDILAMACRMHCKTNPEIGKRIATRLLRENCTLERRDTKNDPLIHDSVVSNNVPLLQLLCELKCTLDIKDRKGNYPLHNCVLNMSAECAEILIEKGADGTKIDENGLTPLLLSVKEGGNYSMIQILARHKQSLNTGDRDGRTALHLVIKQKRSTAILQCLVDSGADVNKKDNEGHGPLHYAIISGNVEAVKVLLKNGASLSYVNRMNPSLVGRTIVHNPKVADAIIECSSDLGCTESVVPFMLIDSGKYGLFCKFAEKKGDIKYRNKVGDTLMNHAVAKGCLELVEFMCKVDKSLIAMDCNGMQPVHTAVINGHLDICKLLLVSGASVTSTTSHGDTLLHLACRAGRMNFIEMLLDLNMDLLHERNNNNMTALHVAVENGHLAAVQILLVLGADPKVQSRQPNLKPAELALKKRNFHSARGAASDIKKARVYDLIRAEILKYMFDDKKYVSTVELYKR